MGLWQTRDHQGDHQDAGQTYKGEIGSPSEVIADNSADRRGQHWGNHHGGRNIGDHAGSPFAAV
jgi:hypothetical protein